MCLVVGNQTLVNNDWDLKCSVLALNGEDDILEAISAIQSDRDDIINNLERLNWDFQGTIDHITTSNDKIRLKDDVVACTGYDNNIMSLLHQYHYDSAAATRHIILNNNW